MTDFDRAAKALAPYGFTGTYPRLTAVTDAAHHISCDISFSPDGFDVQFTGTDPEHAADLNSLIDVLLKYGLCSDWCEPEDIEAERVNFMSDWLKRNASHIAADWQQEIDGTEIGYWVAHGTLNGEKVEYHLGCDFEAGTRFHSDADGWQLTAIRDVGMGEYHILSSGADLHEVLHLSTMDLNVDFGD